GLTVDKPFFDVEWFRDVTARSTLSAIAERRFTDSAGLTVPSTSGAPPSAEGDVLVSSTPLQRKDVRITYRIEAPRTDVSIGLGKAEDRYLGISTLDNDASTASVGFGRSVSMRLRWGL